MPDLPSGTVTFLFTDMEGGTSLRKLAKASTVPPPNLKNLEIQRINEGHSKSTRPTLP